MKRTAIYVYHNENGLIEDYALYFINSLLTVASEICVVLNGFIKEGELKKLNNSKIRIIQRENKGYDFWAYRQGFLSLGYEKLKTFDELIFANSSTFGPLFPFDVMFKRMEKREIDFWGITKHPAMEKNIIKFNPETKIKEHIQSYFMVFKKSMFLHPDFKYCFENLRKIKNKKEAIGHLEVNFTDYFKNKGFKYEAYVDDDILKYGVLNYHQYLPFVVVSEYKCPLIKKTIFAKRFDLAQKEGQINETKKVFEFIKNETDYDTALIMDDILKKLSHG